MNIILIILCFILIFLSVCCTIEALGSIKDKEYIRAICYLLFLYINLYLIFQTEMWKYIHVLIKNNIINLINL